MSNNPPGLFEVKSRHRNMVTGSLTFNTNGAGAVTLLNDPDDICSGVTHPGVGQFLVTLRDRWTTIKAWADMEDVASIEAGIEAVVDGIAAVNTILVRVINGPVHSDASTTTVHLGYDLYRST